MQHEARSVGVVGRNTELSALDELLDTGRDGAAVLLVEGEAGIGKTTVLREAQDIAAARGVRLLACRPGASDATASLSAVADLLDGVPSDALASLPPPQRRALEVALLLVDLEGTPVDPRAVGAGLRTLIGELSEEQPLLITIDDVQWLDPASATALEHVVRRLSSEHVAVIGARRLGEPVRLDLTASVPQELLARVRLEPLSLGAVRQLLLDQLGSTLPRSTLVRIHAASRGNPLFALEIARALADRGTPAPAEPLPVPDDVRELVRERVAALPAETRTLLLAAALLARPDLETLRRVLEGSPVEQLESAEIAGVARLEGDAVAFDHPLHAAAVIATSTAAQRRRMHLRLADVLDDPEERAQHVAYGTSTPDFDAAEAIERGGRAARGRGGLHSAAELLERARDLTPDDDLETKRARGILAADLHMHAGDLIRARTMLESLLGESLAASQRAECLRLLAEISVAARNLPEGRRLLADAVEQAEDPAQRARILLELSFVETLFMNFQLSADRSHEALGLLPPDGEAPVLAEAIVGCAMTDFLAGHGADFARVDRALELEDPTVIGLMGLPPSGVTACLLMYVGRHDEARELMTAVCRRLRDSGDEWNLVFASLWLSWVEMRSGRFEEAARIADETIGVAQLTGNESFGQLAMLQKAWTAAHQGDVATARELVSEAAQSPGGVAQAPLWIVGALALAAMSEGDAAAAWSACRELTEFVEQASTFEPAVYIGVADGLEALVALGELDRVERFLDRLERRGHELDRVWALATERRIRALLLAERGDLAGALEAAAMALAFHERSDFPFERARALYVKGIVERRMRRHARARTTFEEAVGEFDRIGARLWAERTRNELGRIAGRKRRAEGDLTPSEQAVAELAAQGLANKEIAQRLFVTVHTVERHLSSAYAKLGIRSRSQLAQALRG